jgi:class 3 adenylate cyclase/tetratricopeptide (TPR) repeat protein
MVLRTIVDLLTVLRHGTFSAVDAAVPSPSDDDAGRAPTVGLTDPPRQPLGIVTVLYSDLVDSTALGERLRPQVLTAVLNRFFGTAREVVERHGGVLRDVFPGDGLMAVFGTPVQHVDDALRSVEAAVALHAAVGRLSEELDRERGVRLELRTGVNTGEAVVDVSLGGATAVFGDAVNLGKWLQQAADPGEILIGGSTYELVRDFVRVQPLPPIALKGSGASVVAWQLLEVNREGVERPRGPVTALVGREREFALLRWAYERMVDQRRCHLVNVLGESGVGKSRLVDEFVRTIDEHATVLRARCLPYADGIAFKPIAQIVQQAAGIRLTDSPQQVQARIAQLSRNDRRIAARLDRLVGMPGIIGDPEDTFRAVRRVLELLAEQHPLVLIIDDLQEAQPASLESIERLVRTLSDAPVLIVCMARSEFFEDRGNWGGSIANAASLRLLPLRQPETSQLLHQLLQRGELHQEIEGDILEAAGGNPLFLEELVAKLTAEKTLELVNGRWHGEKDELAAVRSLRIEAVVGSHLSRLQEPEQATIERASVIGMQLRVDDLLAVGPGVERDTAASLLGELVRKDFLLYEPTGTGSAESNGGTYRFRHVQIQRAAYRRIPDLNRAELHERYADWLAQRGTQAATAAEKVGFHLDKAHRDRVQDLGRHDDHTRQLAVRAGEYLALAGQQYVLQGDPPASAAACLRRAVELLPETHAAWLQASLNLAEAQRADVEAAKAAYEAVRAAAHRAGDQRIEMHALLGRLEVEWFEHFEGEWQEGREEIERAIWTFVKHGDNLGLAKAWRLLAHAYTSVGDSGKARAAAEQAIEFVRRAGNERLEAQIFRLDCVILFWGPTPLAEVIQKNEEALEWARARGLYSLEAGALSILARAAAMRGDFEKARERSREAKAVITDLGELLTVASESISEGLVELLADNLPAAEKALRDGYRRLEQRGGRSALAVVAANLARVLLLQDREDEAEELIRVCVDAASESQLDTQMKWRQLQALVLARRGQVEEAERIAREAVRLSLRSQQLDSQAEALLDLAEVLRSNSQVEEARVQAELALDLYERKGNLVSAARVRRLLNQLG